MSADQRNLEAGGEETVPDIRNPRIRKREPRYWLPHYPAAAAYLRRRAERNFSFLSSPRGVLYLPRAVFIQGSGIIYVYVVPQREKAAVFVYGYKARFDGQ